MNRGFKRWKLTRFREKYRDRAKLLLPENALVNFGQQMIPEHTMERSLASMWALHFREALNNCSSQMNFNPSFHLNKKFQSKYAAGGKQNNRYNARNIVSPSVINNATLPL